jgi:hypothetical protein
MVFYHTLMSQAGQQLASVAFGWLFGVLAAVLRGQLPLLRRPAPGEAADPAATCTCAAPSARNRPRR